MQAENHSMFADAHYLSCREYKFQTFQDEDMNKWRHDSEWRNVLFCNHSYLNMGGGGGGGVWFYYLIFCVLCGMTDQISHIKQNCKKQMRNKIQKL